MNIYTNLVWYLISQHNLGYIMFNVQVFPEGFVQLPLQKDLL